MNYYTLLEYGGYLAMVIGAVCYVRYLLRIGRLARYNMDMGPPDPDAIEYERGYVCILYAKGRGGASTMLPLQKSVYKL